MNKTIIISIIFLLLLSGCGSSISKEDVIIEKVTWTEDNFWTDNDKLGLLVKNTSTKSVDIKIEAKFYDSDGNFLDNRLYNINAIAPSSQYFARFVLESNIADITYNYECSPSKYTTIDPDNILTNFYVDNGTGYITVKNTSTTDLDTCNCTIIYYDKSNNIISVESAEINDGNIPAGETCVEKIFFPLNYDSEEIYVNAYTK